MAESINDYLFHAAKIQKKYDMSRVGVEKKRCRGVWGRVRKSVAEMVENEKIDMWIFFCIFAN
jgi:hypothetical protein